MMSWGARWTIPVHGLMEFVSTVVPVVCQNTCPQYSTKIFRHYKTKSKLLDKKISKSQTPMAKVIKNQVVEFSSKIST